MHDACQHHTKAILEKGGGEGGGEQAGQKPGQKACCKSRRRTGGRKGGAEQAEVGRTELLGVRLLGLLGSGGGHRSRRLQPLCRARPAPDETEEGPVVLGVRAAAFARVGVAELPLEVLELARRELACEGVITSSPWREVSELVR